MLRTVMMRAARATTASVAHGVLRLQQQRDTVATSLVRQFSATRLAFDGGMSKKEEDGYYSRIASKLGKTNNAVSMEAIDRTVAFLQRVGLSQSAALSAVAKHPMMTGYLETTMEEKVDWLRANGIAGLLLVRAIARHPNILGVREQTLLDVKEWYISHGVPASKIPFLISVFPHAVSSSISENLEPKRQFLVKQGLSQRQVVGVLQRYPQFMSVGLDLLETKVVFLKKRGLSADAVTKLVANSPETLGLSMDSIDAKLLVLDALLGSREATAEAWASNARVIMCKSEQLTRSYKYLVMVVGMPHERVARNIGLLMRSVDRIAQPRFEFLVKEQFVDRAELTDKVTWLLQPEVTFLELYPSYKGGVVTAAAFKKKKKSSSTSVATATMAI